MDEEITGKQRLLTALGARLERAEHEFAHAVVDWMDVASSDAAPGEIKERFRIRALGEFWRRMRLRELHAEVRAAAEKDPQDKVIYFLALDSCNPSEVASFKDWLIARARAII